MEKKYTFSYLKVLVLCLMLIVVMPTTNLAYADDPTGVSVLTPGRVNPGEQLTIDISVQPATDIAGLQCNLSFDASLVTVESVEEGQLLSSGGANTYFNPGTIDNVNGTVDGIYGVIAAPGETVNQAATFAIITLTAAAEGGICSLNLSNVVEGDINGQSVPISVVNSQVIINRAPVLNAIGNKSIDEGEQLQFAISAVDSDNDTLTYSALNLPEGASFNPNTQTFSWSPRYNQAGTYSTYFEVTDGNLTDSENITITVDQLSEDWDVNGDTNVNVLDMILIGQKWGQTGLAGWIREDVNEDGTINVLDMILVGQNWTG